MNKYFDINKQQKILVNFSCLSVLSLGIDYNLSFLESPIAFLFLFIETKCS